MNRSQWPWGIPTHWHWQRLGEVARVVGGGTPSTKDATNFDGGDIPWITPADLSGYKKKFIGRGARNITKKGLDGSGAQLLPPGTVLFSSRAPIGYVAIASNSVTTNQGFKSFVLANNVSPHYVYYYLQRARELAVSLASGTTFLELSGAKATQIPIPIPPPEEQDLIVSEIEKHFTRLDAGVALLNQAQHKLKAYRQAILRAAACGALLTLEPVTGSDLRGTADDLLAEIRATRRTLSITEQYPDVAPPLPNGWIWIRGDDVFEFVTSGSRGWAKHYSETGPLFIRVGNLDHDDIALDFRDEQHVNPPDGAEGRRTRLQPNDVLISITADVGMVGLVPGTLGETYINQHIALARPTKLVNARWLAWICTSPLLKMQLRSRDRGATKMGLGLDDIRQVAIPLPPRQEQDRIADEIDRRMSVIRVVERQFNRSVQTSAALRRSILASAFDGSMLGSRL